MKKTHKLLSLALALLLILSLAACSAGNKSADTMSAPAEEPGKYDDAYSLYKASTGESQMAAYDSNGEPDNGGAVGAQTTAAGADIAAHIIFYGEAQIETLEFDKTLETLDKLVKSLGGFIQSSDVTGTDYYSAYHHTRTFRTAYYEIRVPSNKFDSLMSKAALETLGTLVRSTGGSDDVSLQYYDTEAHLTALKAQEARYLDLLNKAGTIKEILEVEQYLTDVRYSIERLESQIRGWDSLVNYSTLTLNISEVIELTDEPVIDPNEPTYGEQLTKTFKTTMTALGKFFKGLFKFLVGAAPVLVVLAVIAVPIVLLVRRSDKKKKAARDNAPPDNE